MTLIVKRSNTHARSERHGALPGIAGVLTHDRLHDNTLVERMRRALPFDHISFTGLDIDGFRFGAGAYLTSDFPTATLETYYAERMQLIDPLVSAVLGAQGPVTDEQAFDQAGKVDQRLLALLRSAAIKNRTVVPLRRNGAIYGAMGIARSKPFTEEEMDFLSLVAEPLHRTLTKPGLDRFAAKRQLLTAGELLCLSYAGQGLTSEEIGKATGYATDTVNSYLKSAPRKLGAANRVEAVAKAIRCGLIE